MSILSLQCPCENDVLFLFTTISFVDVHVFIYVIYTDLPVLVSNTFAISDVIHSGSGPPSPSGCCGWLDISD